MRMGWLNLFAEQFDFDLQTGQHLANFVLNPTRDGSAFFFTHGVESSSKFAQLLMGDLELVFRPATFNQGVIQCNDGRQCGTAQQQARNL